ncbi:12030_t:CDS:2 [Entrophospora sp. SA101]|nr:12030_t:CDS:2 [Entrophospora sp. SA101]
MFPGVVKSNDINTQEIGRALSDLISKRFKGLKPYLLVNHLGRSKIDVNRPMNEGTEVVKGVKNQDFIDYTKKNINAGVDVNYTNGINEGFNQTFESETQIVWNDYHTFMKSAVEEIEERFNYGIVIDLHGHGHPENYIELGYVLSSEILSLPTNELNSDQSIPSRSSIRALYTRMQSALNFVDLLLGETTSFGGILQSYGYGTIPSYAHPYPKQNERYFHGGYIVQKYGSRHGEQVETRETFTKTLSNTVSWLLKEYYLRKPGNLNQAS